jgi:hypothetical protein
MNYYLGITDFGVHPMLECTTLLHVILSSAKDRSGKPEARWVRAMAGLGTNSLTRGIEGDANDFYKTAVHSNAEPPLTFNL